jgi:geranylgeranyl diphosphate synthase type II
MIRLTPGRNGDGRDQRMDDNAAYIQRLEALRAGVDRRLAELAPKPGQAPDRLVEAVRYALLAPGKRFRPMLTLLTAAQFGAAPFDETVGVALDTACAFEMVHAASLILDDLPSMDNAGLRRGLPTIHRAFDEATAVLAGVGLLNEAYAVIANDKALPAGLKGEITGRIAASVGFVGLIAGQARDLFDRDQVRDMAAIDRLNHEKTGVLIMAAAQSGARIAGAAPDGRRRRGRVRPPHGPGLPDPRRHHRRRGLDRRGRQGCRPGRRHDHGRLAAGRRGRSGGDGRASGDRPGGAGKRRRLRPRGRIRRPPLRRAQGRGVTVEPILTAPILTVAWSTPMATSPCCMASTWS